MRLEYPASNETDVRWNVGRSDWRRHVRLRGIASKKDPFGYAGTVERPPDLDIDEAESVCLDMAKWIDAYEIPEGDRVDESGNVLASGKLLAYSGQNYDYESWPFDRTLDFYARQPRLLTTRFMQHLQTGLVSYAPLWRVGVYGLGDEPVVYVYPDAIVAGDFCGSIADASADLQEVADSITRMREPTEGPRRRQILYIRHACAQFAEIPCGKVWAVFDVVRADGIRALSVCATALMRYLEFKWRRPPKLLSHGTLFYITKNGSVHADWDGDAAVYHMEELEIPYEYRGSIECVCNAIDEPLRYEITDESIIDDARLKAMGFV